MKKLFAGVILSLATVVAFAMPRPADIENALAARDYQSAKSMTQEVLREKPDSAKAHLFNAYVLLKADNNRAAAEAELKTARLLDTNHKVQDSALFGRTVAELERVAPVQRVAPKPAYATPVATTYVAAPAGESALWKVIKWMFWLTIIGAVLWWVYKVFFETRPVRQAVTVETWANTPVRPLASETYQRPYENHGRRYDAPAHAIPVQPVVAAQPSTVVVNNGGSHSNDMLTGMLLADAMHHSHHDHGHSHHRETYVEREYIGQAAPAYQPSYPSDTTDYETTRSSYSSGSDDSWSGSSSSSSYDSGSSSWDGGSSSDSGSSSSSWD